MRGGPAGGRGGMRGMTRGGLRGRARGGAMRGALSLRGVHTQPYTVLHLCMCEYGSDFNCVPKLDQGHSHGCRFFFRFTVCVGFASSDDITLCCTGKRVSTGGPMRGRGSAGRLAMRRGGRHRGGAPGRGGTLSRGAARGGVARGQG